MRVHPAVYILAFAVLMMLGGYLFPGALGGPSSYGPDRPYRYC